MNPIGLLRISDQQHCYATLVYGKSPVQPTGLVETWVSITFPFTHLPVPALCCNTWKAGGVVARFLPQSWRWMTSSALCALPPSRPKIATNVGPGTFLENPSAQSRGQGPAMSTPAPDAYCRYSQPPALPSRLGVPQHCPSRLMPSWSQFSSPSSQNICDRRQQPLFPCQPGESPASQALLVAGRAQGTSSSI